MRYSNEIFLTKIQLAEKFAQKQFSRVGPSLVGIAAIDRLSHAAIRRAYAANSSLGIALNQNEASATLAPKPIPLMYGTRGATTKKSFKAGAFLANSFKVKSKKETLLERCSHTNIHRFCTAIVGFNALVFDDLHKQSAFKTLLRCICWDRVNALSP